MKKLYLLILSMDQQYLYVRMQLLLDINFHFIWWYYRDSVRNNSSCLHLKNEKEKIWKSRNKGKKKKEKYHQEEQIDKIQAVMKWAEKKEQCKVWRSIFFFFLRWGAGWEGEWGDCLVGFLFVWGFFCYFIQVYSGHCLICPKIFLGLFSSHHDGQTYK